MARLGAGQVRVGIRLVRLFFVQIACDVCGLRILGAFP